MRKKKKINECFYRDLCRNQNAFFHRTFLTPDVQQPHATILSAKNSMQHYPQFYFPFVWNMFK